MSRITLGSLFDGMGGWQLAAKRAGVLPIWSSEIEPFPMKITRKHFPTTLQLGDITKIDGATITPADIICMGSPCQDLSVAGKQEGLKGGRSGLFYAGVNIVRRMRAVSGGRYPRFVVWENVPGAFSSNRGHDFRAVLEAISKTDIPMSGSGKWANAGMVRSKECDIAWRVLNAQYWGVAQRRKRIFLVADFGTGRRCADKILFERQSLSGNIATGGEAGEGITGGAVNRSETASTICLNDQGGQRMDVTRDITSTLRAEGHHPPLVVAKHSQTVAGFSVGASITDSNPVLNDLAPTMRTTTRLGVCVAGFKLGQGSKEKGIGYQKEIAHTLSAMDSGNKPAVLLYENHGADSRIKGPLDKSPAINAQAGTGGNNLPLVLHSYCIAGNAIGREVKNGGNGTGISKEASYTLNTTDRHAVAYGISWCAFNQGKNSHFGASIDKEIQPTLVAKGAGAVALAVDCRNFRETETCGTLQAKEIGGYSLNFQNPIRIETIVRRLTPLECERLQGLPDGWTLIGDKSCSDSVRYKAIGNGMAQPCADFIIRRIAEVMRMEAAGDCGKDSMQTV